MKLQDFASPIVAKNHFVKASFGGFSGAGKTRTASEFIIGCYGDMKIKKPMLFIDNEKGSRFLIPLFKEAGIETLVKDTTSLKDVLDAMQFLASGEIGFLFIDSLSKVWYQYVRDYRAANKRNFMTLQDWGKILPSWQEQFSDKYVELSGNIVFTGRGGYTYDMEENEETHKKEFTKSGVKMKLAGETPFEPDINVWMEMQQELKDGSPVVWREAQIMKDRSALIDGKIFRNPTYENFRPVVKYLMGVQVGEVKGVTDQSNLAPTDDFGAQARKRERDIELEKIKAQFDLLALGTSKDDKQIKVLITKKIFGTTSGTEIEKFNAEELSILRDELERLCVAYIDAKTEWQSIDDAIAFISGYKKQEELFASSK